MAEKRNSQDDSRTRRATPRRLLWMRLLVAVVSPILVLLLIETVLWGIGYGQPTSFFVERRSGGDTLWVTNRRYCEHFVPENLSRAPENTVLQKKTPETVRIFVLGGSAAFGDPDPAFGFCRQLELLLNEHSDTRSFEVINAAVTSMNSHVARHIAKDCAAHEADVFVVFMGNNEVVGPYGPPTLPPALYSSRCFVNLAIGARKETRLGQMMSRAVQTLRGAGETQKDWMGMEAFLANQIGREDDRLDSCYRHFQANLHDIVRTARNVGAATVLCTVPTNIRSCPPFASRHREGLANGEVNQWERLFEEGRALERSRDFEGALTCYEQARAVDGAYADLLFCMGRCLNALERTDEALAAFREARDLDVLRFRADSPINDAIRGVAETAAQQGVSLCDLGAYLEDRAKGRVLGSDLLADHVHLNFRGNFLAAYAAMQTIERALPGVGLHVPEHPDAELLSLCRARLLYDNHAIYKQAMVMYRRKTLPPFATQMDHEGEMKRLRGDLLAVYNHIKGRREPESWYVQAIGRSPFDSYLNVRYGEFLLQQRRISDAVRLYRRLLASRPLLPRIRVALAEALALGGAKDEAIEVLTATEALYRRDRREALLILGTLYVKQGRISEARTIYEELHRIDPGNPDVLINLAAAASHAGESEVMKRHLDRALQIAPHSAQAMITMGNYHAKTNRPEEAQKWFAQAVEAEPYDYLGHIGLGIQSVRLGQTKKGLEHVTRSVVLKPDFAEGYEILAAVYRELGQTDKARGYAELYELFRPQAANQSVKAR